MTLNEVKKFVEEKNRIILDECCNNSGYRYCRDFLEECNFTSLEQFVTSSLDIDFFIIAKCLFYINTKDKNTIDDASQLIDSISECMNCVEMHDRNTFLENLLQISLYDDQKFVTNYIQERSLIKANLMLYKHHFECDLEDDEVNKYFLRILRRFNFKNHFDIISVINNINENQDLMRFILGMLEVQDLIRETGYMYLIAVENTNSKVKKQINKCLSNMESLTEIYREVYKIKSFVASEEAKRKNLEKEVIANKQALELLEKESNKDEILNARIIVKKIKDDEIKNIILKYIYSHNQVYYDELNSRLEKYKGKYAFAYYDELIKVGIVVDKDELNDFISCDFDEFKEMIQIIRKYCLSDFVFKKILKTAEIDTVRKIDSYIKDGILSVSFIMRNIDVYESSSEKFKTIEKNINLLNSNGINPRLFMDCLDLFLYDGSQLECNLKILVEYGLKGFLKTTNNYMFLIDTDLVSKIDKFIELGYIDYLEKDMSLLDSKNLKRLDLLKIMNVPVSSLDQLNKVLNDDSFIVNDDSLDNYIFNSLDSKDKKSLSLKIDDLENYRINKRAYSINGVIISSNKVRRLINNGYDLYDAMTYGLILSDNDYELLFDSKIFTLK